MKLAAGKQIYLDSETRQYSSKNIAPELGGCSQKVDVETSADGLFQLRGNQESGADRFRGKGAVQ